MPKKQREDMLRALTEKHGRVVGADWAGAHGVIERPSSLMKELGINPKLYARLRPLPLIVPPIVPVDRTLFLNV